MKVDHRPSISVIMPALNEENGIRDAIETTLSAFEQYGIDGEIVVINDGSHDKTRDIVLSMIETQGDKIRLVDHNSPQGMGASFWDGVRAASKDAVTIQPGDNENDPREILQYVDTLKRVDIVIPFVYNRSVRPVFRNIISALFCFIINSTFHSSFNYTNGTTLYRKSILSGIKCRSTGFFFLAETLIKVVKRGYLFAEVPYALSKRCGGSSKAVSIRSLIKVVQSYLGLVKDIYLSKEYTFKENNLSQDSITARRYREIS